MILVAAAVIGVVKWTDGKRWFAPNYECSHVEARWNNLYKIKDSVPIDIIVIGTSKTFSGIIPHALSNSLGNVSYTIACGGQPLLLSYSDLTELFSICNPKLVCIETYNFAEQECKEVSPSTLSNMYKEFHARKDIESKILSTPYLFKTDIWPLAWSETVRNHDYIFRDTTTLNNNKKGKVAIYEDKSNAKLYLGRYVRFTSGIEDSIIAKYDSLGAPYDAGERYISRESAEYARKIVELCREHNCEVLFFTTPVYYKHIKGAEERSRRIDSLANELGVKHFDLQAMNDTTLFTRACFESTYDANQHATYYGGIINGYLLARYIHDSLKIDLPVRDTSPRFHSWFYGDDQYYYNYPPKDGDTSAIAIKVSSSDKTKLLLSSYYEPKEKQNTVYFKVARAVGDSQPSAQLTVYLDGKYKGARTIAKVDADLFRDVRPVRHELYGVNLIKEFEIDSIVGCEAKR